MPGPDYKERRINSSHTAKPTLEGARLPLPQAVIEFDILTKLQNGIYSPNTRFPTLRTLSQQYDTPITVVRRALMPFYIAGIISVDQSNENGSRVSEKAAQEDLLKSIEDKLINETPSSRRKKLGERIHFSESSEIVASPPYLQTSQLLRQRIIDGTYPEGTPIGTLTQLSESLKASRITVMLMLASNQDIIYRDQSEATQPATFFVRPKVGDISIDADPLVYRYQMQTPVITEVFENAIALGDLSPGTRLPIIAEMAKECGIANDIAHNVYQNLRDQGLIMIHRGSHGGTFVNNPPISTQETALLRAQQNTYNKIQEQKILPVDTSPESQQNHAFRLRGADVIIEELLAEIGVVDLEMTTMTNAATADLRNATTEAAVRLQRTKTIEILGEIGTVESGLTTVTSTAAKADLSSQIISRIPKRGEPQKVKQSAQQVRAIQDETSILPEKEKPLLSFQEIALLNATVGSHEGRSLLFLLMEPGREYIAWELYLLIMEHTKRNVWENMNDMVPVGWCDRKLVPGKLVTASIGYGGQTIYTVPEDKEQSLEFAYAGSLLGFSEKHPKTSLSQLTNFSQTTQDEQGERKIDLASSLLRIHLIYTLTGITTSVSLKEVVERMRGEYRDEYTDTPDLEMHTRKHLESLHEAGIVTYISAEKGKPYKQYQRQSINSRPQEAPENLPKVGRRTQPLYELIFSSSSPLPDTFDSELLYQAYVQNYPDNAGLKEGSLKQKIRMVMQHLSAHGYVKEVGLSLDKKSSLTINEQQQLLLREYIGLIEAYRKKEPKIKVSGAKLARSISTNINRSSALLRKAKENSVGTHHTPLEYTESRVLVFLRDQTEATARDIQRYLQTEFGQQLGVERVLQIIHSFNGTPGLIYEIRNGRIVAKIEGADTLITDRDATKIASIIGDAVNTNISETEAENETSQTDKAKEERIRQLLDRVRQLPNGTRLTFFGIGDVDEELAKCLQRDIGFDALPGILRGNSSTKHQPII